MLLQILQRITELGNGQPTPSLHLGSHLGSQQDTTPFIRPTIERDPLEGPSESGGTKLSKKIANSKELINGVDPTFIS